MPGFRIRWLNGPALAAGIALASLLRIVAVQGVTDIVFVPATPADLDTYLETFPGSLACYPMSSFALDVLSPWRYGLPASGSCSLGRSAVMRRVADVGTETIIVLEVPTMSFRMKLTSLPTGTVAFEGLHFLAQCHDGRGQVTRSIDPVRGPVVGSEVEYGALFAYLFRRFGYPNMQWDADRLARYGLTTPRDDLFLVIVPTIAGQTSQVFSFLAPTSVHAAAEAYRHALIAERSGADRTFWVRDQHLRAWDAHDPLMPYAQAACRTLQDLLRPVLLDEDGAIDIFGGVPRTARSVRPASFAPRRA